MVRAGTGADGIAETTLSARVAAALRRAGGGEERAAQALAHAAFALAVGKTLSCESVTLCVVVGRDRAVPVRLDLAGRADLAELVEDYLRLVDEPDHEVGSTVSAQDAATAAWSPSRARTGGGPTSATSSGTPTSSWEPH